MKWNWKNRFILSSHLISSHLSHSPHPLPQNLAAAASGKVCARALAAFNIPHLENIAPLFSTLSLSLVRVDAINSSIDPLSMPHHS